MNKLNILYIGRHPEIRETVVRLINKHEHWKGAGAGTDEEAYILGREDIFDIILLGCGIKEESEQQLRDFFMQQSPGIIIIQHYGGGSGLLANEIKEALDKRPFQT